MKESEAREDDFRRGERQVSRHSGADIAHRRPGIERRHVHLGAPDGRRRPGMPHRLGWAGRRTEDRVFRKSSVNTGGMTVNEEIEAATKRVLKAMEAFEESKTLDTAH